MNVKMIEGRTSLPAVRQGFADLVAELGEKGAWVWGTYVGNGWEEREIELGFPPAAVLLVDENGTMRDGSYTYGGLALRGSASRGVAVTDNGFTVYKTTYDITNRSTSLYYYLALR